MIRTKVLDFLGTFRLGDYRDDAGTKGLTNLHTSGTDTAGFLEGAFVLTGGTGDFAGATGDGTFRGTGSSAEERGTIRLRGRLVLP